MEELRDTICVLFAMHKHQAQHRPQRVYAFCLLLLLLLLPPPLLLQLGVALTWPGRQDQSGIGCARAACAGHSACLL
jgi:hypothetical protein